MATEIIIGLFVLAIVLIGIELFVVPGFGVSGILGILALVAGIVLVSNTWFEGAAYSLGALVVIGLLIFISYKLPATRKFWKKLSLDTRQTNAGGYVAPKPSYESYVGRKGIAISHLRPAGTGDFAGERLDVVTEGGYISAQTPIVIIEVEGTRIVVRASDQKTGCDNKEVDPV